ncbi:hypothetical protein HPB50_008863 [Hyalomma asiaticum]|uniref:Uncharacterized protein n=1 Tax=Hyalomma asiaticum TaxID=266040 RepID=A0ACB7ST54_HYAAI|nr:hypothetical protein HPB50_008863 [Hyalomma asiaticum]
MAADSAEFQRLYTLSRVATNRQQFEAAVTATAAENPENPAATTSQGNLMCFDEGSATHEAHPPAYSVFEGARHITPSPLPEFAESREPSRQTCSTHSAAAPDLTGQSESPQVLLRDAMRMIECLTGVVQNTLTSGSAAKSIVRMDLPTYSGYHDLVSANEYLDRMLTYQQATGLSDGEMLERVVPVSLTDQAARWFRLTGHRSRTMSEFRANFREEFLPADYQRRLRLFLILRKFLEYTVAAAGAFASQSWGGATVAERLALPHERTMAADSADFQRLYTLSRVATNRQQFEAAVTATAAENPENPAATTSQGNLMCFDEGSATHEAHPPAYSVFQGARHITPSPSPEFAERREPSRHTCSTHSAAAPDLTGQSESPQRDHPYVRRQQQRPARSSSLRRVFYARPGSCGPQLVTSRGAATAETTAAAHGEKKQTSKTAKKFPVRSSGSSLGKFWKLGDTSIPSPSPHHRNPVTPGGAELRRPLFDKRPCPHTSTARQPLGPVHIARASSAPCQYARQRSFPQGEEALVPRHTTIGPSRKANGRSFEHHQTPAAPNVSRAQYQLNDSSSSSPGTPLWPATADDSATTAAEGTNSPLFDTTFLTA